ncbi:MAG: DUF4124 domain-containing protein [Pseudomonadota bacterium]
MMNMRKPWIILLLLAIGHPGASLSAAEVYTWTDAKGLTHLTDRPPPPGVQVKAVAKDKRPIVEKLSAESQAVAADETAREQIRENQAAWQTAQDLTGKVTAAQAAYEDAVAAVAAERAKFAYSAERRKAPRETVIELEKTAQTAFEEYRKLLDTYNQATLAAREAEQRAQSAIEAVGAKSLSPQPDSPPRN